MSIIFKDVRVDELTEEVDYIKSLIDEGIADLTADVATIQGEQIVQDSRISALESRTYPEAL